MNQKLTDCRSRHKLRGYQSKAIDDIRKAFRFSKRVFFVLPTGAGKTFIFSHIANSAIEKGKKTWIVCPRNELIWQSKKSVESLGGYTGIIAPSYQESKDKNLHIVSKDTWIRRKQKIKNKPDFVIVDEGHLATERYEEMIAEYPDVYFLFVSATPEKLNGKALDTLAPESAVVYGPSIEWLIQNKYLSEIEYYCPPIAGIENLKFKGQDIDREQFEEWMSEKNVYAKTIEQYEKYCTGKQSIVFCRDVKHAEQAAEKFNNAGYRFENIDGTMARKKIRAVIDAVRTGELDGLTSCELVTYGLDVPNVKSIIMLRRTRSRALFYQMLGRGLRYTGEPCVVLDQVGNALLNCDGQVPWKQPVWNYSGKVKRIKKPEKSFKICPYLEFRPCLKLSCVNCELNPTEKPIDRWVEIEGELVPMVDDKKISERPEEEKAFYTDRAGKIISKCKTRDGIRGSEIRELCEIARETKRHPLWVYNAIQPKSDTVNRALVKWIGNNYNYDNGWAEKIIKLKGIG